MAERRGPKISGGKNAADDPHYFSDRLRRKLNRMRASPAVILEAPSGYGKTTAVRDWLEGSVAQNAYVCWFTAVDEAPAAGFRRFCREIEKIDGRAGERLSKIDFPNAFTIGETCDALRSIECDRETWLVIDNFHLFCSDLPAAFSAALLEHGGAELHVVLVTQTLSRHLQAAIAGRGFLHITSSDLRLEAGDIRRYYALTGVALTEEEAQRVLRHTDGWMIAVYLQLCAFRETGAFSEASILPLMEQLVWNRLTDEQQIFFLYISPFETISARQMAILLGCDVLPDYAAEALSTPLISHDPALRRYEPHAILFELMDQKRAERGEAFERECLLRAGDLCRDEDRISEALAFYARIDAWERMLSLDLSQLVFEEIGDTSFLIIALDIAQRCPEEVRRGHPLSMLHAAWALRASGQDTAFAKIMEELDEQLEEGGLLRAEWLLLSAYLHYPRLEEMLPVLQRAEPLFEGSCSRVILPEAPWAFGGYFQLTEFHLEAGKADREAEAFEAFIAIYSRLTDGHGSGADVLFRTEVAYCRGDMANTEILAHKAAFLAESRRQRVIQLGAAMMMADIAILKGDSAAWQRAIDSMERAAFSASRNVSLVRAALDTARGSLLVELGVQMRIADWLKNRNFPRHMLPPMTLNALYVHVVYLLHQGNFAQAVGILEAWSREAENKSAYGAFSLSVLLAVGYALTGESGKAAAFLELAAEKGLPDGFMMHFAGYSRLFPDLIGEVIEKKYPSLLDTFNVIRMKLDVGWQALHDSVSEGDLPVDLTAREHEIALLAAGGLHNGEIAKRLFVTENTVRAHLRAIFQKLDIDRRAKLAEMLK